MANSEKAIRRLKSVSFLKLSVNFGDFFVFENNEMMPAWAYKAKTGEKVRLTKYTSTSFKIFVDGKQSELIQMTMAYHSNWKAVYKNDRIPILKYKALMQIHLPSDGRQIIHFTYAKEKRTPLLLFIAGVVILLCVIFYSKIESRRRRHKRFVQNKISKIYWS